MKLVKALWGLDPHPSKSKLRPGLKQVELYQILIRIGPDSKIVRKDSKYGTPVAIQQMLYISIIKNLTTPTPTTPMTLTPTPTRLDSSGELQFYLLLI
jgi:hypothetical protein